MLPVNIELVGVVVLVAIAAAALSRSSKHFPPSQSRHGAMTGFRGLLALGIFLHHSFIWSHYVQGRGWLDAWGWHQFGESRVVLFFMLTSTLFYGKLLDSRGRNFDWLHLYVSRVLRLGPAYWLAMSLMIAIVGYATLNHVDQAGTSIVKFNWWEIVSECAVWLTFSMFGMPSIDGYFHTPLVTAAVTWTLPYEVTFYMLLPLLALPLRVAMPAATLALGLAAAIWAAAWSPDPMICVPFIGGMAVALLIRVPKIVKALRTRASAAAAIAATTVVFLVFPTVYAPVPLLMLLFAMAVVATDNDLFGILRWRAPQALGNWGYSLYLLHGIALYTLFVLVIGLDRAKEFTGLQCLGVICAYIPVVLTLAWASHRWIESPPMRAVPAVVAAIRKAMARMRRQERPTAAIPVAAPAEPAQADAPALNGRRAA